MSGSKSVLLLVVTVVFNTAHSQRLAEQKIESYSSCQLDNDCNPNSFCYGNDDNVRGKCKCLDGYEMTFRNTTYFECSAAIKLGEACEKDVECQVLATKLAVCSQYKICTCNSESNAYEGKCYMNAKIGDICMSDGNCFINDGTVNGSHAFCTDGRCSCRIEQKPSEDRSSCLTTKKLGEYCISDEECILATPNTRCLERCVCATEYTLSRDESECVKAATKFGESCEFDGQCSKFLTESICNNDRQCGCSVAFHGYGYKCVTTRKPGETCNEDAECISDKMLNENVKCDRTCKCIYGTKEDGTCKIEITDNNVAITATINVLVINVIFLNIIFNS